MAYTFTDATLLGYQLNKNYLGEGTLLLNTTKNISIEGVLLNPKAVEGVEQTLTKVTGLLTGIVNRYDAVIINGYNLGSGKVSSLSFPEENPIRVGKYRYNIEILENNDFTNIQTGSIYGTFLSGVSDKILSLDENLNFDNSENGDYSYNHNINIQYYDDGSDLFTKSKNFANSVYYDTLNIGLIGEFSGFYNILKNKKNYFSENYDLINKKCSFNKKILINKNYNSNYTTSLSHNLTFDTNGKITVTENGKIKALDNTLNYTADNYFNTELANSYTRCQNVFNVYVEKYGLGVKDSLFNQPFNLGKTADWFNNSLEYSVSYVNDPAFEGNVINTYNITVNKDIQEVGIYTEQGEIIQVGQVGSVNDLSTVKTKYQAAKTRASTNYPTYKLKNSSLSAGNFYTINLPSKVLLEGWAPDESDVDINGIYVYLYNTYVDQYPYLTTNAYKHISLNSWIYFNTTSNSWELSTSANSNQWTNPSANPNILPRNGWIIGNALGSAGTISEISTYNNQFSYSIEKTNDNSILEGDPYYKSLSMKIDDQSPTNMYKEYIIANKIPKNILYVFGNQVEIGSKTVTINGTLVRPTLNPWSNPLNFPLSDLKSKSISGAFNLISNDAYIDNINYSYDSDNNFSFNLSVKYLDKVV
jgi:hypothetical protein